jgi:hypothetical protein
MTSSGIELTFSNLAQLFSALSPVFITFFLVMLSIFNQNVKGIVFVAGALLATFINILLMNVIQSPILSNASSMCNLIEFPLLTKYNSPSATSMFIAFTFAYLFMPMMFNKQMNYPVIASISFLFVVDMITRMNHYCNTLGGSVLGGLVGFILGMIWYGMFHMLGYDDVLYFQEMESNKLMCKKPSKQTFKCSVYKNGKLVSSHIK